VEVGKSGKKKSKLYSVTVAVILAYVKNNSNYYYYYYYYYYYRITLKFADYSIWISNFHDTQTDLCATFDKGNSLATGADHKVGGPLFKGQNWAPIPHIFLRHNVKHYIISSLTSYECVHNVTMSLLSRRKRTNLNVSNRLPRAIRIRINTATKNHDSVTPWGFFMFY